jgi:hypothetical protein
LASSSAFGAVKVDGTTITASSGVISAAGGSSGALILLEQHTASSSASLDFTTAISSSYDSYRVEFVAIIPATTNVDLLMRVNTGSGFISTGVYSWIHNRYSTSAIAQGGDNSGTATSILIGWAVDHISNNASWGFYGSADLFTYPSTFTRIIGKATVLQGAGAYQQSDFGGVYNATTAITQVRFLMSSGNIASGTIRIYGYAK